MSSLFLEIPQPCEITSLRGRIRSELIGEDGFVNHNEGDAIPECFSELIEDLIYHQLNFDYEVIGWAYAKLSACRIGANNQDSAFMMDRLKQIIMEA